MEWIETPQSSLISQFAYNAEERVLTVQFKRGGVYTYQDVPSEVFEEMKLAPSTGKFFLANIKGVYEYERQG